MTYKTPSAEVVAALDALPAPLMRISPDGRAMLLVDYETHPPIVLLARPLLRLGGIRIDPVLGGRQRLRRFTGITIVSTEDGSSTDVRLPEGASIGVPVWSPDSARFAFTRDVEDGLELWIGEARDRSVRRIEGVRLNDVLTGAFDWDAAVTPMLRDVPLPPFAWTDSGQRLLVRLVPDERGHAPAAPATPDGPRVAETGGRQTQVATYQDLLADEYDERLFEHYATARLASVDAASGTVVPLGAAGLITDVKPSPDGRYLLVHRLQRPFSWRVPYQWFARAVEVWDASGAPVAEVADLPVSEVPWQGVPAGPRAVGWQPKKDATLVWAEALDGGNPRTPAEQRDALISQTAPFMDTPREVLRLPHRFAGWDWTDREDRALLTEWDQDRRWRTTWLMDLAGAEATGRVLFDLSANDVYGDPGAPVYRTKPDGERVLRQDEDWIYLAGRGASAEGERPFLDRLNLETGVTERLFQSDGEHHEAFMAFAGSSDAIVTRRQSTTEPPNLMRLGLGSGERVALTGFADPHPFLAGMTKQLVRYTRADGVPLSGTLYLPPGWQPGRERLPLLLWAYPMDYSDPSTAGQVRGADTTFTRLEGYSPLWFVTRGYAVLNDAAMPVVGDRDTMNDTFVEQIVDAARAAVDALDEMGVVDRARVIAAGHSYGGFMTANLLAHSELFAAGIARSGAYNRTLTPFGFQTERRTFWEAPEAYLHASPFCHADAISAPLLLIHGMADNNTGTFPMQTERLYQALDGLGKTARMVLLPHESHAYRARETVLHVLAEMFEWADRYVTNRAPAEAEVAAD